MKTLAQEKALATDAIITRCKQSCEVVGDCDHADAFVALFSACRDKALKGIRWANYTRNIFSVMTRYHTEVNLLLEAWARINTNNQPTKQDE